MKTNPYHNQALRLLIVDDDHRVRAAYVRTLEIAGFTDIQSCSSWPEAASVMIAAPIHVLLLDILMPGISGKEALKEARTLQPGVLVIMVTGVNDVATAVECMKNGASDYLTKPVSGKVLVDTIRSLIVIRKLFREPRTPHKRSSEELEELIDRVHGFHPSALSVPVGALREDRELAERFVQFLARQEIYSRSSLTLSMAASEIGSNISYLSRVVNRVWAMNFRTMLNSLRLAVFLESCRNGSLTDSSIEGIARSIGYTRAATFYTAFKSVFGITPSQLMDFLLDYSKEL